MLCKFLTYDSDSVQPHVQAHFQSLTKLMNASAIRLQVKTVCDLQIFNFDYKYEICLYQQIQKMPLHKILSLCIYACIIGT